MTTNPIVRCGSDQRTHDEIRLRATRLAGALTEMGVTVGDRYALLLRNDLSFVEITLAGAAIGAIPVPVNWHWRGDELTHLLTDSGSKVVFVHTSLLPGLEEILPPGVQVVEVAEPVTLTEAYGIAPTRLTSRYRDVESLIASHDPATTPVTDPPLAVIYTSGTTGRPKGILRQPFAPGAAEETLGLMLPIIGLGPGMRTLIPAPLYHTAPNIHLVFAFALGCDIDIMVKFDAEKMLRMVEQHRIQHIQMVPTMFVRMVKLPKEIRTRYDLSSLEAVVHAAAPCPPDVKREIIEWFGPIVLEYYGGSETSACVSCTTAEWLEHPGTVGRPIGGADVRILDPIDHHEMPVGETGDIYIKPLPSWPDFTYLGNDAKRREMEVDGYLNVGDIGYVDADGFLYLSDRRNDMVISGGVNIYPAEIESCIIGIDGVSDVAVFGIPDPEFGESLAAHVEVAPATTLTDDDIRSYVAARLAGYKVPKVVVFDDHLPRHDSGKLVKRKLRELYWRDRSDA